MPPPQVDVWSNEKTLAFIKLLAAEPVIWDPKDKQRKLKHKVHDAWVHIGEAMNMDIEELKAKKKSLMATFRPLTIKKKASLQSGSSAENVYHPTWFAYDAMEDFLGSLYAVKITMNTEDDSENEKALDENTTNENIQNEDARKKNTRNNQASINVQKKRRQNFDVDETQRKLDIHLEEEEKNRDDDESGIYGKLLAIKLRKHPYEIRQIIMYKIDGLLLEINGSYQQPSVSPYSSFSTPSPAYIMQGSPAYTLSQSAATNVKQSPVYSITPSPATFIQRSPVYTIIPPATVSQSEITISIPEDSARLNTSENLLSLPQHKADTLKPRNRIHVLSEEVIKPGNNII